MRITICWEIKRWKEEDRSSLLSWWAMRNRSESGIRMSLLLWRLLRRIFWKRSHVRRRIHSSLPSPMINQTSAESNQNWIMHKNSNLTWINIFHTKIWKKNKKQNTLKENWLVNKLDEHESYTQFRLVWMAVQFLYAVVALVFGWWR